MRGDGGKNALRWVCAALLALIVAESAWCVVMLFGVIAPPTQIPDVMHDTYYAFAAASQFLKLIMFALIGLFVVLWATLSAGRWRKAAAWAALLGTMMMFLAANWMTLKPQFFDQMSRRYPSEAEGEAMLAMGQAAYQGFLFGSVLVAASALCLGVGWVRRYVGQRHS